MGNGVKQELLGMNPKLKLIVSLDTPNTVFQAEIHTVELYVRELKAKECKKRFLIYYLIVKK